MMQRQHSKIAGTFFVAEPRGLIRIVQTQDLDKRLWEWEAASPYKIQVAGMITTPSTVRLVGNWLETNGFADGDTDYTQLNPMTICHSLKTAFGDDRVRGDWFRLDNAFVSRLPLEPPRAIKPRKKRIPTTVLSVCGQDEAFPRKPKTLELPSAPLVWAAVEYAKQQTALEHPLPYLYWTNEMEKHITAWLVSQFKKDVSRLFVWQEEFKRLEQSVMNLWGPRTAWHTTPWLVMQGATTFAAVMAVPSLLDALYEANHHPTYEATFASDALEKILSNRKGIPIFDSENLIDILDYFEGHGGRINKLVGWNGKRFAKELTSGSLMHLGRTVS